MSEAVAVKQPKCFSKTGKAGKQGKLLKQSLLISASAMALAAGVSDGAHAAACAANTTTIGSGASCTAPLAWTLGSGTLVNNGTISGAAQGVVINGAGRVLNTITNNGTLTATGSAIQVNGTGAIGTIINTGYIQSPTGIAIAVFAGSAIGPLVNTGTIFGGIINRSSSQLVIDGVTDGSGNFGTFTAGGRTIESTVGGLRFAAGNALVDLNMNVGLGQTVTNAGASVKFINNRSVNGNFAQTSGNLMFNALSTTSFPKLTVSGTANLSGGTIVLVPLSGGNSAGTYTIISAAGGVTDSASAVAAGYTVATSIAGNNLLLTLTLAPSTSGAPVWTVRAQNAGGQAVPIGPVLDALTANGSFTNLLAALTVLPTASQNTALHQLGTSTLATQAMTAGASFALSTSAIEQRQTALLAGEAGGKAAGSAADGAGVWGQILGNRASLNSTADAGGFHTSAYGLTFGADTHITGDVVGGGAFSWLHNDLTGDGGSSGSNAKLDSYQLAGYGTWRPHGGGLYFNGLLSLGSNSYSQSRNIDFLGSTATASYRGRQGQIKLGMGVDIPARAGITVTPLASIQAARVETDGYQESGAGVANLTVGKQSFNSVESELAVKLTAHTDTGLGRLTGDWQTGWLHSFTNNAVATTATMGGVNFVTTTNRLAADGAHLVLRATLQRTSNLSFSVEYDGTARSQFRSQTAIAKVRYDF